MEGVNKLFLKVPSCHVSAAIHGTFRLKYYIYIYTKYQLNTLLHLDLNTLTGSENWQQQSLFRGKNLEDILCISFNVDKKVFKLFLFKLISKRK